MSLIKENFFENILFKFESYSCDCVEDIEHIAPGVEPISKFKLQAIPEHPVLFGYAAKDGLVRIASNGTVEEKKILSTLISLANKTTKELSSFLKKNGFLFPVSIGIYEELDEMFLYGIINRLKMTVELMTAANEIRKNYKKICDLTISLLFSEDLTIKTDSMRESYASCHHSYVDSLMNPPVQLSYERQQECFVGDSYNITDSVYGTYSLSIQDYNDIIGGYKSVSGFQNGFYQNVTSMFVNYERQDMTKKISDFLYEMSGDSSMEFSDKMKSQR